MLNQNTIDLVKKYEGCRLVAYTDPVGVWTIGYGHTSGVTPNQHISQEEAEEMLKQDLELFSLAIKQLINVPINDNQLGALTSLTYNIGVGNFRNSTLLKLLNAKYYVGAAEQFSRWNKAGGKVLPGLVKRREAERELFLMDNNDKIKRFSMRKDANVNVSPNFKVKEFQCKDGTDTVLIDTDFVNTYLQRIRDKFKSPTSINSAYRTPTYNKKIGGATNSYHMAGRAFDIVVKGYSPSEVAHYAKSIGVKGVIKYNTFVHIDSRETPYYATNNNGKVEKVTDFM